jgi:hypothetical protein
MQRGVIEIFCGKNVRYNRKLLQNCVHSVSLWTPHSPSPCSSNRLHTFLTRSPMSLSRNLSLNPVSESDKKPKAGPSRNGLNDRVVPPMPVQITKACTQCRREKSRCDNERPCHTCIRKGRTELCVTGCYRCRHERLR